ncbi:MAG: ferredoxin FdxA [Burkholderiaceae bacterium]
MSYVVTEACIKCRYTDCVEICPVDAFREGPLMLVIDPDTCIDCGVCEPECPISAIQFDLQAGPRWTALNRRLAAQWPEITSRREPLEGADASREEPGKLRFVMDVVE